MRWVLELFIVVVMLGAVTYFFAQTPQGPVAVQSNRETMEQLYTNLARLVLDPLFLSALEGAICGDANMRNYVQTALEVSLGPQYLYNVTALPGRLLPPCQACLQPSDKLISFARPRGYVGPAVFNATFYAVLPSGADVRIVIAVGRP
jgi:hypothetical protein